MRCLLLVVSIICCCTLQANEKIQVLSFKKWKQNQIIDAQNKVVRLSNKMHLLKTQHFQLNDEQMAEMNKLDIEKQQNRLNLAIDNLQFSKDLTLDDYYAIYLSQYTNNSTALSEYLKSASNEEMVKVLQAYLQKQSLSSPQNLSQKSIKYFSN